MSALDRWYETHPHRVISDRPRVHVWYPNDAPTARLNVIGGACHEPDRLPDGPLHAYLTISGIEIGGLLDELELLVAAARIALRQVRTYADEFRADASSDDDCPPHGLPRPEQPS